ncbi:hypothetical protein ACOMHN_047511 [Nucella lapillus]
MERCAECGKRGETSALKRCSRCKTVRYCSTHCQSRDWPRHKVTCGESSVDGPWIGADTQTSQATSTPSQNPTTTTPTPANPFASMFDGTFYATPWQRARSRAQEAFPGLEVTDDLTTNLDLTEMKKEFEVPLPFGSPLMPGGLLTFPFGMPPMVPTLTKVQGTCGKVLLLRLVTLVFPPYVIWLAKDREENHIIVGFDMDSPVHYFRPCDLQAGHFLCIKRATVTVLVRTMRSYIILKDPSLARVFKI